MCWHTPRYHRVESYSMCKLVRNGQDRVILDLESENIRNALTIAMVRYPASDQLVGSF